MKSILSLYIGGWHLQVQFTVRIQCIQVQCMKSVPFPWLRFGCCRCKNLAVYCRVVRAHLRTSLSWIICVKRPRISDLRRKQLQLVLCANNFSLHSRSAGWRLFCTEFELMPQAVYTCETSNCKF